MRRYGTPQQYIDGYVEMYGRRFKLDRRAFVPDEQTELLVETALRETSKESLVLDIGTGCGWIPITIKLESGARTCAVDIERGALELAAENARIYGLEPVARMPHENSEIGLFRSSYAYELPIPGPDIMIADLPWGDEDHILNPAGRIAQLHMPSTAIFHPERRFLGSYTEMLESIECRGWHPRIFIETGLASEELVQRELPGIPLTYHRFEDYLVTEIDMR